MEYFVGKSILITGATGFLAKMLVEKILRNQPDIKKFYVLIRAKDSASARERFNKEILKTELFRVLKGKIGESKLNALVEEKVVPVAGDITYVDFGIEDSDLKEQMLNDLDVIINSAATTAFDERYDVSMNINALGPLHILNFAERCSKKQILVHVSTAYVSGKERFVEEKEYHLGETHNENSYLDIDLEKKIIEKKLKLLESQNLPEKQVRIAMKELGLERARVHGWRNTYSLTKSMGEMLLLANKENTRVVFIRPTTILSTYKDPFPGWIEGARTMDIFVLLYGKGKGRFMMGDQNSLLDAIPGDMVVNAMIAAILHHARPEPPKEFIYHNPWTDDKSGKLVKVKKPLFLTSEASLNRFINFIYYPMLQGLKFANIFVFNYFEETCRQIEKNIGLVNRIVDLYRPYLFYYGVFDDTNIKSLKKTAAELNLSDTLFIETRYINWEDYFTNTHIPGVVRFAF